MQRFFLNSGQVSDDYVTITGTDANHIKRSLRMRIGDIIIVCDMQKNEYECEIVSFEYESVKALIKKRSTNNTEPNYKAYLYQALPKGDKMDYIVQKSVELGVYRIIPFISERTISRPDNDSCAKKVTRWQRIAEEAAKQCGRGIIPEVSNVVSFDDTIRDVARSGFGIICYEGDDIYGGKKNIGNFIYDEFDEIRFIIGAEGGFSIGEVEKAYNNGIKIAGLGKRILRCETAPGFVLACLIYEKELKLKM